MKYGLEPREKSRVLVKPDQWYISDLNFIGNYHLDQDFLRKTLGLKMPGNYTSDEIKNGIDRLYGLGGFDQIYYNLTDSEKGKNLNINITTKKVFTQNIGLKANTTDAAAILVNTTQKNYGNVFGLLSTSAELSINPGLSIMAETNKTNLPTFGINIKGKYQNYNIFDKGTKIFKANIFYTSGALYIYQPFLNRFNLGIGVQEEYFHGDIFKKNDDYPITSGETNVLLTNAFSYLSFDNMDDFYFPRKGTNLYTEFSLMTDFKSTSKISPVLLFKMRNVFPVSKNSALLLDLYGRAIYNSDFPLPKMTFIGGEPYSQYFNYHLPFVGLSAVNMADRFAYIGLIGLRFKVADSQYVSALFNGLYQTDDPSLGKEMIFGGGIKYALKTLFGPLDMTLGYSGSTEKVTFSANFGYWF